LTLCRKRYIIKIRTGNKLIAQRAEKGEGFMNKVVEKAKEIMENGYVQEIPELEIGDEVKLADVWDGEGNEPEESYSYQISDYKWINYCFEVIQVNEDPLETIVRITNIELL